MTSHWSLRDSLNHAVEVLKLVDRSMATEGDVKDAIKISEQSLAASSVDVRISPPDVEGSLLRGALWLTANALKEYHDAPHAAIDDGGIPKHQLTVSSITQSKALDALARADKLLKEPIRQY